MKLTPNYDLPYAEGTDPRRDYPAAVDEPRALALDALLARLDTALGGAGAPAVRTLVLTRTTDANGFLEIPAAEFGLTAVTGCTGSLDWGLANDAPHWAACTVTAGGTAARVLVLGLTSLDGGTGKRYKSRSVTVRLLAWGTAA